MFGTQGRGEDVLGAFEIGALEFFDGEQQVLRTGLGEGGHAAIACFAHLIECIFAGEMHDVDRRTGDLRHGDGAVRLRLRRGAGG